ncbi:hypothetical protein GWI33_012732 [Rhynchophorus ferrugineus]|uniref:Uncharacterized protein n=1 Tax=Rhynchophorus ferrugineus TaxID=354439 RepID=A0A834MDW1_RHYFE|nr:hypothetical protein GWI33_012732 [Rhynchophorus ferrugineus]
MLTYISLYSVHVKIVVPVPVHNHKHIVTVYKKPKEQKKLIVHKHVHSHSHGHKHGHLHGHNHNHPQAYKPKFNQHHGFQHYDYGHKSYDWSKYSGGEYQSNNGFRPSQPLSSNSYGSPVNYDQFQTNPQPGYNSDDDYNNFVKSVKIKNYYSARDSVNDSPDEGYYSDDHASDSYDITESNQFQYSSPEDGNNAAGHDNGSNIEYHDYDHHNDDFDEYEYADSTNVYRKRKPPYRNRYKAKNVKQYWTVAKT